MEGKADYRTTKGAKGEAKGTKGAITEEAIRERLALLERERDGYVAQANQQLAAYAAAIGELKLLLGEPVVVVAAEGGEDKDGEK